MVTPGSWIGKTPASNLTKMETDISETSKSEDSTSSVDEMIESLTKKLGIEEKPAKRHTRQGMGEKRTPHSKARRSKDVSVSTVPSRQNQTPKKSGTSTSGITEHAIHQNIKTGIFWCDCDGFKSHNEADANYHMMQNSPKMAKKPYIRKPHLTDRPLANNEALQALRDSLPEAKKYNPGKKPRTVKAVVEHYEEIFKENN